MLHSFLSVYLTRKPSQRCVPDDTISKMYAHLYHKRGFEILIVPLSTLCILKNSLAEETACLHYAPTSACSPLSIHF